MSGIDAVVTQHFKLFFRDVSDKPYDEIHDRNTFCNSFVVFVSGVMEGYIFTIVVVNARRSNHRTAKISADILDSDGRSTKVRLGTDIKAIRMVSVNFVFHSAERRTKFQGQFFEKDFSESVAKKGKIKVFYRTPWSKITGAALGNKGMDVGIPFKVTTKGMEDTDKSRNKVFGLIHFGKHAKNNIPDGMEEAVKEGTVTEEINTQFFRDSKNTVSVGTGNKFAGHRKRTLLIVPVTTGRTEAAFAAERGKLKITAVRASEHGSAVRGVTAVNHFFDVFHFGFTWMQSINDFFIMVSKNGL